MAADALDSLPDVKKHATLSAGASVDHGVDVETTEKHANRAADRVCYVSTCWGCTLYCWADSSFDLVA